MVAHRLEGGCRIRAHVAGVEHTTSADRLGCIDRVAMMMHGDISAAVAGHDEHLRGALEGVVQAFDVLEVSLTHSDTALVKRAGLFRVANADTELGGGQLLEESLSDDMTKLSGSAGDNDHKFLLFRILRAAGHDGDPAL